MRTLLIGISVVAAIAVLLIALPRARSSIARFRAKHPDLWTVLSRSRNPLRALILLLGARFTLRLVGSIEGSWVPGVKHALSIVVIIAIVWLAADIAKAFEELALARIPSESTDDAVKARRAKTKISFLRQLVVAVIIAVGVAAILMTFPQLRLVGTGILASAGLVSVVAALAAQTSLTNVFAGIQLALGDSIRVGDVVRAEGESGVVDDITLTNVVIALWDERRLILPSSYFISQPFENWTRSLDRIGGSVFIDVDWRAPFAAMRAELPRILAETNLWDGRTCIMRIGDATEGRARVRIILSAADTLTAFALESAVREAMITFLVTTAPESIVRSRIEDDSAFRTKN